MELVEFVLLYMFAGIGAHAGAIRLQYIVSFTVIHIVEMWLGVIVLNSGCKEVWGLPGKTTRREQVSRQSHSIQNESSFTDASTKRSGIV